MRYLLALLLAAAPLAALAASLPPALMLIQKQGGTVGRSFAAPDGLTGWVLTFPDRSLIVYTTVSGNYLISGLLVNQGGANLTEQYSDTYIEQPAANKLAAMLAGDTLLVDEGDPHAPEIYAYIDANCSFCNKLWNGVRPYVQSGKLRVHWVVLAFLKESSPGRGAAILAAPDRLAALTQDESKFDKEHEEGGIAPLAAIPPAIESALSTHTAEMTQAGSQGTPLLLYRKGSVWTLSDGMPRDLPTFLNLVNPAIPPTPAADR